MDFRYNTEHTDFRSSLRGLLREAVPLPRVRELAAAGAYDAALWKRLCAAMDLAALHAPTEYGGAGATLTETAIAFEELGRGLVPVPLATTTFAIEAVLRLGDADQRRRLLPELLTGSRIGAFTAAGADAADPASATVLAAYDGDCAVVSGECSPVLHGSAADLFIVPARAGGTLGLYVVDAHSPGVVVEALPSFDGTRPLARVRLSGAPAEALAHTSADGLERVIDVARVLLAAEMLGGAEACLELSVEYARTRRQFDRPIGSFQAVKHACAEMLIEIDATRLAVMFAAMNASDHGELAIAAPLAKAQAADTFTLCAGSAIQVHGGIAFTWEHDLHLYYRRARSTEALFGSSTAHRALLADRIGL